jgi:type IV secretory pathway TrbL component
MEKVRIEQHSVGGLLWVTGWLFTIGFLNLPFWKGLAALFIWPAYLGYAVSSMMQVASNVTP